jgi:hypothetical protein
MKPCSATEHGPAQGRNAINRAVFTPAQTPGIDVQAHDLGAGPFVQLLPRSARRSAQGSQLHRADDGTLGLQMAPLQLPKGTVSAEHHIPFLNQKRVIALRAKTDLST